MHHVAELEIVGISLLQPSDGGLNVLQYFFANRTTKTTLTKVRINHCDYGVTKAARIVAAFNAQ
jgi:hypothetical protein